jgi:hypothetical protein
MMTDPEGDVRLSTRLLERWLPLSVADRSLFGAHAGRLAGGPMPPRTLLADVAQ